MMKLKLKNLVLVALTFLVCTVSGCLFVACDSNDVILKQAANTGYVQLNLANGASLYGSTGSVVNRGEAVKVAITLSAAVRIDTFKVYANGELVRWKKNANVPDQDAADYNLLANNYLEVGTFTITPQENVTFTFAKEELELEFEFKLANRAGTGYVDSFTGDYAEVGNILDQYKLDNQSGDSLKTYVTTHNVYKVHPATLLNAYKEYKNWKPFGDGDSLYMMIPTELFLTINGPTYGKHNLPYNFGLLNFGGTNTSFGSRCAYHLAACQEKMGADYHLLRHNTIELVSGEIYTGNFQVNIKCDGEYVAYGKNSLVYTTVVDNTGAESEEALQTLASNAQKLKIHVNRTLAESLNINLDRLVIKLGKTTLSWNDSRWNTDKSVYSLPISESTYPCQYTTDREFSGRQGSIYYNIDYTGVDFSNSTGLLRVSGGNKEGCFGFDDDYTYHLITTGNLNIYSNFNYSMQPGTQLTMTIKKTPKSGTATEYTILWPELILDQTTGSHNYKIIQVSAGSETVLKAVPEAYVLQAGETDWSGLECTNLTLSTRRDIDWDYVQGTFGIMCLSPYEGDLEIIFE